jgi:hypothetical protein
VVAQKRTVFSLFHIHSCSGLDTAPFPFPFVVLSDHCRVTVPV